MDRQRQRAHRIHSRSCATICHSRYLWQWRQGLSKFRFYTGTSGSTGSTGGSPTGTSFTGGLTIVSSASQLTVSPGQHATVTIHTSPGATGTIEVDYKSGASHASGLVAEAAASNGNITWTWYVGTRTTPGSWPVHITVAGHTLTTYLHVQ